MFAIVDCGMCIFLVYCLSADTFYTFGIFHILWKDNIGNSVGIGLVWFVFVLCVCVPYMN